jgi:hypothetical protein
MYMFVFVSITSINYLGCEGFANKIRALNLPISNSEELKLNRIQYNHNRNLEINSIKELECGWIACILSRQLSNTIQCI